MESARSCWIAAGAPTNEREHRDRGRTSHVPTPALGFSVARVRKRQSAATYRRRRKTRNMRHDYSGIEIGHKRSMFKTACFPSYSQPTSAA